MPLVGVHHIEGHIAANFIEDKTLEPPFMCLVVSGGHTHLVKVTDYGQFEILGVTRDDAAGEAFDKVARAIGLGYPGGPKVDKLAKEGNPDAIEFPRAKISDSAYDFSFSGLNTIYAARKYGMDKVALAGGVASNSALRASMKAACEKAGIQLYYPAPILCTDNAAMIGAAGYYEFIKGTRHGLDLNAVPNLKLGER